MLDERSASWDQASLVDECCTTRPELSVLPNEIVEKFAANRLNIPRDGLGNEPERPSRACECASAALALALGFLLPNEKVEQLAANRLTIPQDAIASLLQRLVRHVLVLGTASQRSHLMRHDSESQRRIRLSDHLQATLQLRGSEPANTILAAP
jgi:hypothetical protein